VAGEDRDCLAGGPDRIAELARGARRGAHDAAVGERRVVPEPDDPAHLGIRGQGRARLGEPGALDRAQVAPEAGQVRVEGDERDAAVAQQKPPRLREDGEARPVGRQPARRPREVVVVAEHRQHGDPGGPDGRVGAIEATPVGGRGAPRHEVADVEDGGGGPACDLGQQRRLLGVVGAPPELEAAGALGVADDDQGGVVGSHGVETRV